jgi:hypothetical protein
MLTHVTFCLFAGEYQNFVLPSSYLEARSGNVTLKHLQKATPDP